MCCMELMTPALTRALRLIRLAGFVKIVRVFRRAAFYVVAQQVAGLAFGLIDIVSVR